MARNGISTWFDGDWHDGDVAIMSAADHGTWLGTLVFDGARTFGGKSPDLDLHCQRIVASAGAMAMNAPVSAEDIEGLVRERIGTADRSAQLYIRPMMWSRSAAPGLIAPDPDDVGFAICIEEMPMALPGDAYALGVSPFRRPRQDMAVCEAKAGCLYANNGRIMADARKRGFHNALSLDFEDNVAETASSNVFLVRDGHISTPKPNGTFLAGITRMRVMELLREDGVEVEETVLTLDDFEDADEIFLTANANKITPITRYKDRDMGPGQMSGRAHALYLDYAASGS